jgi:transcriptional regulator with XRE-family HTH domain
MRIKHEGRWTVPPKRTYNDGMTLEQLFQKLLTTRSATDVGLDLGVQQSTVSRYASGGLVPELSRVADIALVLKRSESEIETLIVQAKRARTPRALHQRVSDMEERMTLIEAALQRLTDAVLALQQEDRG